MKRITLRLLWLAGILLTVGIFTGTADSAACDQAAKSGKEVVSPAETEDVEPVLYPDFSLSFSLLRF